MANYKTSAGLFLRNYLKTRAEYATMRRRADPDTELGRFLTDGIVVFHGFLDRETCARMRAAVPPFEQMQKSPESASRIVRNVHERPEFAPFFQRREVADLVEAVVGPDAEMLRATVERREILGPTGSFSEFFHCDTWRHRIRAFLYLTDVGPENGPFVYAPRTMRGGWWRYCLDRELHELLSPADDTYEHNEKAQFAGALFPHQASQLFDRLAAEPIEITGQAGTMFIFDARGFHRAKPLAAGERIVLSSYWIRRGEHC